MSLDEQMLFHLYAPLLDHQSTVMAVDMLPDQANLPSTVLTQMVDFVGGC